MTELNINQALEQAKDLIATDSSGNKWIKVEDLQKLQTEQAQERVKEKVIDTLAPKPKSFAQAKSAAFQDPELREAFANRPPEIGPSPTAA
jgi:predicted 2-oxoglutarate/Fe(II)-dependent dioxygenase YbiX